MNIFFSNQDPRVAARNLNHWRVQNKMILENCQMMCNVLRYFGKPAPYKRTHDKHPSNVWLGQSRANLDWLIIHTDELLRIYKERYNKDHAGCTHVFTSLVARLESLPLPEVPMTPVYLAIQIKDHPDIIEKYSQQGTNQLAKSPEDAILAYKEYLQRKSYWQPEFILE